MPEKQTAAQAGLVMLVANSLPTALADPADPAYQPVSFATSVTFERSRETIDGRTLDDGLNPSILPGDKIRSASAEGYYDLEGAATDGQAILSAAEDSGDDVWVWIGQAVAGTRCYHGVFKVTAYTGGGSGSRGDLMPFSASLEANGPVTIFDYPAA